MEIRLLDKSKDGFNVCFLLKDSNPAFANAIRRSIVESVPVMAIEDVEFRDNSSLLYDEMIAHRLGMVSLTTDLKGYNIPAECKCSGKGCASCSVKMTLKESGPGVVYAEGIKSKDPKVKPVHPKTPIVKLLKGQELELEATAVLGRGSEHAKWCPGVAYYKYRPEIEIVKEPANPESVAKSCPVKVFELKGSKITVSKDNLINCHLCNACIDASNGALKLVENSSEIVFYLESFGQLSCREILLAAADAFDDKLGKFEEVLAKLK